MQQASRPVRPLGPSALAVGLIIALCLSSPQSSTDRATAAAPSVVVDHSASAVTISGAGLRVRVDRGPWNIAVIDAQGHPLLRGSSARAPAFQLDARSLTPLLPRGHAALRAGANGTIAVFARSLLRVTARPNGADLLASTNDPLGRTLLIGVRLDRPGVAAFTATLGDGRAVIAAAWAAQVPSGEHFFGLGEQFGGVDLRGKSVPILVQDGMTTIRPRGGYAPVPFFISSGGYGFYLAGTRPSVFSFRDGAWDVTQQANILQWYVLDGPRPADAIARYDALTGFPPMPPPWTLGVWKTLIGGQQRVMADARRLRAEHIPVSVIWTYDAVDERVKLGWPYPNFARIHPGPYPNLPAFTAGLHGLGYQVLGYVAPEFTRSRPGFSYPARHDYFVRGTGGRVYLLDLTNQAAWRWWVSNLHSILYGLGFDGWLLDLGDRLPPGARFADGRTAEDLANLYPLLLARSAYEAAGRSRPDGLFVMRSGFAGSQALQRAVWPGDQRANWDRRQGLPAAISAGLSWGISGEPFWGSDIGGYLDGGLTGSAQEELWMRWLEFGAFSPIMRDQLGNKGFDAVYLWSNNRTQHSFRLYAQLHQSLFPYLYAAALTAHLTGMPIMRHLVLAYPTDSHVYGLDDEYLLGPDLLVAPVITAHATTRDLYLPAGRWLDYWTGTAVAGGRVVRAAAPVDRIPVFVRGGAIVPLLTDPGDTLAPGSGRAARPAGSALTLRLFPDGPGETTALADGTTLSYQARAGGISVAIAGTALRRYTLEIARGRAPVRVTFDGRPLPRTRPGAPATAWSFDPRGGTVRVAVEIRSGRIAIEG